MTDTTWMWIGFNAFVLAMLALDLGVFHRKTHVVSVKESLAWTGVWVTLALAFNAGLWYFASQQKALEFFTGYLIEKSLSVDNVFVLALLFSCFAVPAQYQHKVLFWVILGALIMRAIMIFAGAALINQFSWIIYIFGACLILTGIKMVVKRDKQGRRRRARLRRLLARLRRSNYVYDSVRFQTTPRAWLGHSEPIGARRSARTV